VKVAVDAAGNSYVEEQYAISKYFEASKAYEQSWDGRELVYSIIDM